MNTPQWQHDPARYECRHTVAPQYSHLDTIRHINNVAVHSLHLEARIRHQLGVLGDASLFSDDVLLRPRRTVTHFSREAHYPHDITATARLVAVAPEGYRVATGLFQHGRYVGVQDCWMGAWHHRAWQPLPDAVHSVFAQRLATLERREPAPWPDAPARFADADYPLAARISGRYADLDPDGVIGELALSRYVEQARAAALRPIRNSDASIGLLVARVDLEYRGWQPGIADAGLGCGIERIGNSSFAMAGAVTVDDEPLATARTTMVVIDRERRRPTPIGDALRDTMAPLRIDAGHETPAAHGG